MVRLNTIVASIAALYSTIAVAAPIQDTAATTADNDAARLVGTPAMPTGYRKQVFVENFTAGSKLSTARWTYDLGTSYPGGPANWGTGEVQTYTNSAENFYITKDGTAVFVPRKTQDGKWTSARIETNANSDFACPAKGKLRVQARLKLGAGYAQAGANEGFWPAFWLLGSPYRGNYQNWPSIGEIDILESVNALPQAWNMAHCGQGNGGPCNESNGIGGSTPMTRGAWHNLRVDIDRSTGDWTKDFIAYYIDDKLTRKFTSASVQNDRAAWDALVANKKFILLNVAVGGGFPNALANKVTPTAATIGGVNNGMEVDYVVAWTS